MDNTERELERKIKAMETTIVKLRQSMAQLNSTKKRTQNSYSFYLSEVTKWEKRAWLALSRKNDYLAKEALLRKKYSQETLEKLKIQIELDQSTLIIADLQRKLAALEMKVTDYKTLQARLNTTRIKNLLQDSIGGIDTGIAMDAFERMEDKVMQIERESQSIAELGGMSLEQQFAELDAASSVKDELAIMREQLIEESSSYEASDDSTLSIDEELRELRIQLRDL